MTWTATTTWPGNGTGSILLSHATGFCKEVWTALAEELQASSCDLPILAWDYYGHGSSGRLPHPLDWWQFGRQARHIAITTSRPRIGVGHSMGAASLAMAEVLEPGSFDLLVLVEPIVFPPPYRKLVDNPMSVVAVKRRNYFDSRREALENYLEKPAFAAWDRRALDGYVEGGLTATEDGFVLSCRPEDEAAIFAAASAHGLYDRLSEVRCPTVILIGETSTSHTPSMAADLAGRFGGDTRWEQFDSASHFLPMEQPRRLAELVSDEVGQLP